LKDPCGGTKVKRPHLNPPLKGEETEDRIQGVKDSSGEVILLRLSYGGQERQKTGHKGEILEWKGFLPQGKVLID